jgi:hypothetical protein
VIKLVSSVVVQRGSATYVPVRISLLLRRGSTSYDLFMKLSESNFVKFISTGDAFVSSDATRFTQKGIEHLYISTSDADAFVRSFEQSISVILKNHSSNPTELSQISLESIEKVERIAKCLGWKTEVL